MILDLHNLGINSILPKHKECLQNIAITSVCVYILEGQFHFP